MPLSKLVFKPGLNKDQTNYASEGGWYDIQWARFRSGFPEKMGGWTLKTLEDYVGSARTLFNWITTDGNVLLAIGTNEKIYVNAGNYTHKEKIIACFAYGFMENIMYYNPTKNNFIDIYNMLTLQMKTIYPATTKTDSIIQPFRLTLYLTKSNNNEPINLNKLSYEIFVGIVPDLILTLKHKHFITYSIYANSYEYLIRKEMLTHINNIFNKNKKCFLL